MKQEAYVSYEIAKLLKEKGFNEVTLDSYRANGQLRGEYKFCNIPCPTHQMAMAWLRKKGIFIQLCVIDHNTITVPEKYYFFKVYKDRRFISHDRTDSYYTYEDAVEAALKYCLEKLI